MNGSQKSYLQIKSDNRQTDKVIKRHMSSAVMLVVTMCLALTGCVLPSDQNTPNTTNGQPIMETQLVETMEARTTKNVRNSSSFTYYLPYIALSRGGGEDNAPGQSSSQIATQTPISDTPTMTLTPTAPDTLTPTPAPCLLAKFVQDINVPPGTTFTGGTKFTKIWRVQNVGSCAWNSNFSLILVSGDALGAKNQVAIGAVVQPGSNADLLLDFVAPKTDGKYRSGWMIYNTSGQVFGVGSDGTDYLWADIRVKNTGTSAAKNNTATTKPTTKPTSTTAPSNTSAPTLTRTSTATVTQTNTSTTTSTITITPTP
jgi:hypothetical protein